MDAFSRDFGKSLNLVIYYLCMITGSSLKQHEVNLDTTFSSARKCFHGTIVSTTSIYTLPYLMIPSGTRVVSTEASYMNTSI